MISARHGPVSGQPLSWRMSWRGVAGGSLRRTLDALATARRVLNGRYGWLIKLGTTAGLLAWMLRRVDVLELWITLRSVDLRALLAALVCCVVATLIGSYKWQRLLAAYGLHHRLGELFRLNLIGIFYSLVLPGQVSGEILKAIRLAGRHEQRQTIYLSVFLDRLTGLIALATLGLVGFVLASPPLPDWPGTVPTFALLIGIIAAGSFLLLGRLMRSGLRRAGAAGSRPPVPFAGFVSTSSLLCRLLPSHAPASTTRWDASALAVGLVFQLALTAVNSIVASALGISVHPAALAWIAAVVSLVQLVPLSIAGIGPRETAYMSLLSLFGIPASLALAMSLLIFGLQIILGVAGVVMELGARLVQQRSSH
ncbi:MAG: lysylphosphatidylglycerol synthase transmembrane domain-containing protein [Chloroflexota bacterium]